MYYKVEKPSIYSITEKCTQLVDMGGGNSSLTLCRFGQTIGTKMMDVKTGDVFSLPLRKLRDIKGSN